jgi:hypothetical protein
MFTKCSRHTCGLFLASKNCNTDQRTTSARFQLLYRPGPPEPHPPGKLRELALVFALVVFGLLITVGAIWAGWEIGVVIP